MKLNNWRKLSHRKQRTSLAPGRRNQMEGNTVAAFSDAMAMAFFKRLLERLHNGVGLTQGNKWLFAFASNSVVCQLQDFLPN